MYGGVLRFLVMSSCFFCRLLLSWLVGPAISRLTCRVLFVCLVLFKLVRYCSNLFEARFLIKSSRSTAMAGECIVCLEKFVREVNFPMSIVPCGHVVCRPCIEQWFRQNPHRKVIPDPFLIFVCCIIVQCV